MPRKATEFTEAYIKGLQPTEKQYVKSSRGLKIIVYPSGTKAWSLYITDPRGDRIEHPIGYYPAINVKDAKAIAIKMQGDMIKEGKGIAKQKDVIRFGEYILTDGYQSWSRANRKAHKSIMDNLTNVLPSWFHRKRINSFTNNDFQKFVDGRLSEGVKPQTINRNLNNIRSVFRHAYNQKVISENPTNTFAQLPVAEVREKFAFTDDERLRLLRVARDRNRDSYKRTAYMEFFVEIGVYCGLRKSELSSLTWDNFVCPKLITIDIPKEVFKDNRTRHFQTLNKTYTHLTIDNREGREDYSLDYKEKGKIVWHLELEGADTKSSKVRKVPIPTHLVKRIREYLWIRELPNILEEFKDAVMMDENLNIVRQNAPTKMGWFRNKKIIPHKDVKKSWATLHELAGLNSNSTIHTMRHDFCTQQLHQGVDVYTVQRLAGHADIRTTMKYVHYLEDEDFENLNNLQYNYLQDPE